jgi:hypothetical protein
MLVCDLFRECGLAIRDLYVPHPQRVDPMSSGTDDILTCIEFAKWR